MANQKIRITQDSGTDFKKRSVEISREDLEKEIKAHFKWRGENLISRFYKSGTTAFDGFIQYLLDKGYTETK